jgi:hypothetical protein
MGQVLQIPLDDMEGHIVDPPIVDFLHFEPQADAYVVTFVPSESTSHNPTEVVVIKREGPTATDFQRISLRLEELKKGLGQSSPIARLSHAGGGNFTLHFADGHTLELADASLSPAQTLWGVMHLQDIAQAAEIAFAVLCRSAPLPTRP